MRQIMVQAPPGRGGRLAEAARGQGGSGIARWTGQGADGPCDVVVAHVPNDKVGAFLSDIEDDVLHVHISLGDLALLPPLAEATGAHVVRHRSPVEVHLSGLQSVGSWTAYIGYAVASGVLVWAGMAREVVYLLVAAMLIAPFAGPAMTAAMGAARGDRRLLLRSLWRLSAGLLLAAASGATMAFLFGPRTTTSLMQQVTDHSIVGFVLPVVAGAAGAMTLVRSERDSLVSSAGVGMLVAVSLAPAAAMLGLALALHEEALALRSSFLLALNVAGLVAAASLVFLLKGLRPRSTVLARGDRRVAATALALTLVAMGGAFAWQVSDPADLQRATIARQAESAAVLALEDLGVEPLQVQAMAAPGADLVLVVAYVDDGGMDAPELERAVAARIDLPLEVRVHVVVVGPSV